jgi:hypothetical protein
MRPDCVTYWRCSDRYVEEAAYDLVAVAGQICC